ncbi:MAG: hypothetical protein UT39_C0024G0003 [Candidatus Woesebacteria bacterium GW2011_GWA1_39_21]|uniref:Uncharacterized protein n=1 Tax=Candidatus Woesebacteria bacterium GW2011_GWA1_39_21 TaxID=1618550 RepID=A0A0G0N1A5_9BACT|nr:MAG: hypothetical protein UT39_C0024G0003 [Candidatus Woesebacteria bacterium GW2011_GWA1_39_21]
MRTTKQIIFYTDHRYNFKSSVRAQKKLASISSYLKIPIISVSLKKLAFGDKNIYFPHFKQGDQFLYKEILSGLENSRADIVYLCSPDVLYTPSHFEYTPDNQNFFYFNTNITKNPSKEIATLSGSRSLLIDYFKKLAKNPVKNPKTAFLKTRFYKSFEPLKMMA